MERVAQLLELIDPAQREQAADLIRSLLDEHRIRLEEKNRELNDARLAALNMMEDAILAKEKSDLAQFAIDHSTDPAFWIRPDGSIAAVNQTACDILGYSPEKLCTLYIRDIAPDLPENRWPEFLERLKSKKSLVFESRQKSSDGRIFPVEIRASFLEYGNTSYIFAFVHDITRRIATKRQISDLARFPEEDPNPVFRISAEGTLLYSNKAASVFYPALNTETGKPAGKNWEELVRDTLRNGHPQQSEYETGGMTYAVTRQPVKEQQYVNFYAVNITGRKHLELALEKRIVALTRPLDDTGPVRFEDLFNLNEIQRIQDEFATATGVASIITSTDGTPITQPSNFTRLCFDIIRKTEKGCANCFKSDAALGLHNPDGPIIQPCLSGGLWDAGASIEVGGRHIANWLIGQVRNEAQTDAAMRTYAREIGVDESTFMNAFYEVPVMSSDHFKEIAQALFTLANQLSTSAYQNMQQARFISEQKKTSEELIRLSTVITQSPESVIITDLEGIIRYVNPAFEQLTGWTALEACGRTMELLKSGQHDVAFYTHLWKTITSGRVWQGRIINRRKNGELFTEEASISPIRDPSGKISGYTAIKRDISEELRREEQFHQSQKMEAVGQLAGGLAHDFNNILQAIIGFSQLLTFDLPPGSAQSSNAAEIEKAARRAVELTRQLLAFSRRQPVHKTELDLNHVIRDSEVLIHMLMGSRTDILYDLSENLPPVFADAGQLTQVIINLAVNAHDAMPDGGRLTIRTQKILIEPEDAARLPGGEPGGFICLTVADTGCGMSEETKSRLFEPFFTTKEVGKGTGLGLSVVYGIVKQAKGWIAVESKEGKGTTFSIYLPVREAFVSATKPDIQDGERILLVEDDTEMLELTLRILEQAGYKITVATSAEAALELFNKNPAGYDLLFCDIFLPGLSGTELANRIREKGSRLPILLFSGYLDPRDRWNEIDQKGFRFLQKPFNITSLLAAVHETLYPL